METARQSELETESELHILMASVNGEGTWGAVRELRAAMLRMRRRGRPTVIFLEALHANGRPVGLHDEGVAALILGYRLTTA